ncbi:hypothetical protein JMJ35_004450 [Cladonia borealis]|uniref:Uncharacterized protein n=1 Tax=Cladonia borealis TaxID=184061 RepID=A0AA39V629_9LECA|nr:hypothetical protein JMJ35_004450 [Cladonia borealis]
MATNGLNGLNGPDKKSKQPVNGLRRDQPLFGSRRSGRPLQQAPDFLTDSLNASYIPSPSPPKSPTRQETRARPRQAFGNGRSVAHSSKATPRSNDENKRPLGLSSSDRRNQQHLKPLPRPSRPNTIPPSSNPPAQSPARTQTPSPPRGRQNSVTSPTASESSPGRGYAEAYQRINEEENLAQEESIEDMEEISGYDFNEQDRSQDLDRMRLKRIQHSTSPISLKASRRASPRGVVEDNIPANDGAEDKENMIRDTDSESGTDYNATVTDTSIGSGSSQYAKDLQRLGAIKEGAKIFSKARVGEKVGLSVENLQRRNGSNESLGRAFSAGSLSQRGSDPSVNIPKAWGRKARPGKDWLNRINSKSGRFTGDVPKRRSSGEPIITDNQEREWAEPIDSWIAAASEVPLPSGEEGSSQTALSSHSSTPTTELPRSSSVDRRRQWEANEDEFTGRSLQVSDSPPMRIRNATLDRYRDREIENLEKIAVTTNRLGELRERGSDELLRRRPPSRSTEEKKKEGTNTDESSPRRQSSSGSSVRSRLQESAENGTPNATLEDAGEPIPDTPVVIYRSKSNDQSAVDSKGGMKPEDMNEISRKPQHERKDSHDLLKRLARATSDSPSPAKEQEEESRQGTEAEHRLPTPKSPSNVKTPVVTGAWVDQTMGDTPQASKSKADLKTPLVTGAWIDTPLPSGRGPPLPTPSNLEDQKELQVGKIGATDLIRKLSPSALPEGSKSQDKAPLKYSGPPLPKSALDGIIKQAKSTNPQKPTQSFNSDSEEDPTLHLGDSTIQSLEDFIANDTEILALHAPTPPVQGTNSSSDPSNSSQNDRSSTSTNPSRLTDLQSYTHLLSRLTNLAPSIRASKKQIASLQRAVSAPPSTTTRSRTRSQSLTNPSNEPCNEAGEFHDFIWPCARCGCPATQPPQPLPPALLTIRNSLDTTTLTIPIPRLWTWPTSSWRPRLTWLGLLTLLAWILVYAEYWARDRFCHPLYASSMVGYGVDINAPRPPFVLAKVIYRYTPVGSILAPIYHAARILTRLVSAFVGYIIGFIFGDDDETSTPAATAGATKLPVSRDARIPKPVWGPDLSLMDDEYL